MNLLKQTIKDFFTSKTAWIKEHWFRHLLVVIVLVFGTKYYAYLLSYLPTKNVIEQLFFDFYDLSFGHLFLLHTVVGFFTIVGFEMLQLVYISRKNHRQITEQEFIASKKDVIATTIQFIIVILIAQLF